MSTTTISKSQQSIEKFIHDMIVSDDNKKQVTFLASFPLLEKKHNISISDLLDIWIKIYNDTCGSKPGFSLLSYTKSQKKIVNYLIRRKNIVNFLRMGIIEKFIDCSAHINKLSKIIALMKFSEEKKEVINEFKLLLLKMNQTVVNNSVMRRSMSDLISAQSAKKEKRKSPSLEYLYSKLNCSMDVSINQIFDNMSQISSKEFALEITRRFSSYANNLNLQEFIYFEMNSEKAKEGASKLFPNVSAAVNDLNKLGFLVQTELLEKCKNSHDRLKLLKKFIRVGREFISLKNYHGVFAMAAGLGSAPIAGMIKKFDAKNMLSYSYFETLQQIDEIASGVGNFKNYRNMILKVQGPIIPYFGVLNRDVKFVLEGNPIFTEASEINVYLFDLLKDIFDPYLSFNKNFLIEKNVKIDKYFTNATILDEDKLYEIYKRDFICATNMNSDNESQVLQPTNSCPKLVERQYIASADTEAKVIEL